METTMPLRPQWMYDVRSACQSFYGLTFQAERAAVEEACERLCNALPAAESVQETDALDDLLMVCLTRAGTALHRDYHRRTTATCPGSPVEAAVRMWADPIADPRRRVEVWSDVFWSFLDTTHPTLPIERIAAILQASFRKAPGLDDLAHQAGCSRSALTRAFKTRYGMSCFEYVTRLRLRSFIDQVARGATAEQAARAVGYTRYHNLLHALSARTALKPKVLRSLPHDEIRAVLDDQLALDLTACARMASRA